MQMDTVFDHSDNRPRSDSESRQALTDDRQGKRLLKAYIDEINKSGILNPEEERHLARQIEVWKHLEVIKSGMQTADGGKSKNWEIVFYLLANISGHHHLLSAFCSYHSIRTPPSLRSLISNKGLIEKLNGELSGRLLNSLVPLLLLRYRDQEEIGTALRELTLNIRLLPKDINGLFKRSPPIRRIKAIILEPSFLGQLESREAASKRHFDALEYAGRRAQSRLEKGSQ